MNLKTPDSTNNVNTIEIELCFNSIIAVKAQIHLKYWQAQK